MKNLSLSVKVLLIVGVFLACLIASFGVNTYVGKLNSAILGNIRDRDFPSLEACDRNIFLFEKLQETLQAAVATNEEAELDNAKDIYQKIKSGFEQITKADPIATDIVINLDKAFEDYYQPASKLSADIVSKKIEMGAAVTEVEKMKIAFEDFDGKLKSFRADRYQVFTGAVQQANSNNQTSLTAGVIVLAFCAIITVLVFLLIGMLITLPIKRLAGASKEAAEGYLHTVQPHSQHDEIGVLTEQFNVMVGEIIRNNERMQLIIEESMNISAAYSLEGLKAAVDQAFARLLGKSGHFSVFLAQENFLALGPGDAFYQLGADSKVDFKAKRQLGEIAAGPNARVVDPKIRKEVAVLSFELETREFESIKAVVEALSTSISSALSAIRLVEAMAIVDSKTAQIRSIMTNISQGICTIDRDLNISGEYARFLEHIVQQKGLEGRSIKELLFDNATIESDAKAALIASLSNFIGGDPLEYELNSHLLLREISYNRSDESKILELDWIPMIARSEIERVMLTIRDVTEIRKLEAQAKQNLLELRRLNELVNIKPQNYYQFSKAAREGFKISGAHAEGLDILKANSTIIKRELHTIKGNSRALGLSELANAVHDAETALIDALENNGEGDLLQAYLDKLSFAANALAMYDTINFDKLGRSTSHVSPDDENRILSAIAASRVLLKKNPGGDSVIVHNFILEAYFDSLDDMIKELQNNASSISQQLGKKTPTVQINPSHWMVKKTFRYHLLGACNHMVRNSVDHGFDDKIHGVISFDVKVADGYVVIDYQDNGRGLNLDRLAKKFHEVHPDVKNPTDEQIGNLIFEDSVSTAEQVTDISGRGVGMDAVKSTLDKAEGSITIKYTEAKRPDGCRRFKFEIKIPDRLLEHAPYHQENKAA